MKTFEKKMKQKLEEKTLDAQLLGIGFFPESKEAYEELVGYKVKVISASWNPRITFERKNGSDYTCIVPFDVKQKLVRENVEAVINCNYQHINGIIDTTQVISGIPIKKLEK
ncbi:MAG: hypothetical protein V1914_02050 [archaeon]